MAENDAPERVWLHYPQSMNTTSCCPNDVEYVRADLAAPASDLWSDLELVVECIDIPLPQKDSIVAAIRRTQVKFADAVRQAETRTEKDAEDAAKEIVRAWLLTSNPYHLIDYKQQLIDRIAAALRAEGEKPAPQPNRVRWLLHQIISDLPKSRDWLDPEIEAEARAITGVQLVQPAASTPTLEDILRERQAVGAVTMVGDVNITAAASTEVQGVTHTDDENVERWRSTMIDRDTTVATTTPDFTENAKQVVREWLSDWVPPEQVEEQIDYRLVKRVASFASEAATQGQATGRQAFAAELLGHLDRITSTTAAYHLVRNLCLIELGREPDSTGAAT